MKIESLIRINPEIVKFRKRFIYGTDDRSIKLFLWLANVRFFVDGFIDDSYDLGNLMFNKPVIALTDVLQENTAILCWDIPEGQTGNFFDVSSIFVVPEDLYKGKVAVWGTGKVGKSVCEFLKTKGIHPDYIINKNENRWGGEVCGIPIVSPEVLLQSKKNTVLIEALVKYREVEEEFGTHFVKRYKQDYVIDTSINLLRVIGDEGMTLKHIHFLETYCNQDELWLYGRYENVRAYDEVLHLINIEVKGYLFDRTDVSADYELDQFSTSMAVEEIIYIDKPYVLIVDDHSRRMSVLKKMGLLVDKQIFMTNEMYSPFARPRTSILDLNLGYTYLRPDCYPGMTIYGNNKDTDYKIAVLGGSTTDGYLYRFKSWPEYLYTLINNSAVSIYNGGCSGYNSASLLIKLIRDMLSIKPDMIIVYDGINELNITIDKSLMLGMPYLEEIFEYANNGRRDASNCGKPYDGIPFSGDRFDKWLYRIEIMHSIAQGFHIPFFVFLQPFLQTKKRFTLNEKKFNKYDTYGRNDSFLPECQSFIKKAREGKWKSSHPYICDLTDIFDNEDDVYLDQCHVRERGNKIIADAIYKHIRDFLVMS